MHRAAKYLDLNVELVTFYDVNDLIKFHFTSSKESKTVFLEIVNASVQFCVHCPFFSKTNDELHIL